VHGVSDLMEIFAPGPLGQLGIEGQMRVGLTDQDEGESFLDQHLTDRLCRVEIIAEKSNLVGPIGGGIFPQPAFGGGIFTILLGMAILRHDKLRRQWDDFILVRRHDHRGEHTVRIGGGAVTMGLTRTLRTGDFLRREILRAI